ncbi:hypothetical protein BZA05DRAFT_411601 [Tricharina praecox]|uniref:uncharacterized protein n=1 Tax=Tricharina praecox TaxID=43433 RepID=UPI00222128DA|nr:uncharacterized protein BZA05DRAFT_411601 [Tricharina praecox]KAI5842835.1 hypothetical protein BZA05DRAFT_411601 [Tricharina praecox]
MVAAVVVVVVVVVVAVVVLVVMLSSEEGKHWRRRSVMQRDRCFLPGGVMGTSRRGSSSGSHSGPLSKKALYMRSHVGMGAFLLCSNCYYNYSIRFSGLSIYPTWILPRFRQRRDVGAYDLR